MGEHMRVQQIRRKRDVCACDFNNWYLVQDKDVTELPSNNPIGVLTDPFACCKLNTTVGTSVDTPVLEAVGSLCQIGICCPCPGFEVAFPMFDAQTRTQAATLKKIWTCGDVCPMCSKEWSAFDVEFENVSE